MRPGPLSAPLGDLLGVPIVTSAVIPRRTYYTAGDPVDGRLVIMCHPSQVDLLKAAIEAVEIVRDGLADVLEWLGDAYPPRPDPKNRPMPARHLAPMIERVAAMGAATRAAAEAEKGAVRARMICGEHGPELFAPRVFGATIPASVLRGLGDLS